MAASGANYAQQWGSIYTSPDSGATWVRTSAPPNNSWLSVASSADGAKLVAAASDNRGYNWGLYTSTDSGATWRQLAAPPDVLGNLVACSGDGTTFIAAGGLDVYTSTDSGGTWKPAGLPSRLWSAVVCSADGSKLAALSVEGFAYYSVDSGATWTAAGLPDQGWAALTSSADGSKLVALGGGGEVYTVQLPVPPPASPSPRLDISSVASSLLISWLVPSTRFVLQQSLDLTAPNWTDVAVAPTLNLTNLHLKVSTSLSTGSRFYRLKQQ